MNLIENISHPAVHSISWSLIHSVWQITLIVLLWRMALHVASGSSALFRYRLSLMAFLVVPTSFFFTFARQWQQYSNAREIVSIEADSGVFFQSTGSSQLFLMEQGRPAFLYGLEAYSALIFWVYLAGMLIFAAFSFLSFRKIYRLKFHNNPLPDNWQQLIAVAIRRIPVSSFIPVRMSTRIDIPMVIGFIKPMVLLPAAMLFSMTPEQVESIVMHELYHIKRRDHLINMIQHFFEILLFYHPAMWWISKTIRKLREESVDEWVVSQIDHPADYAQALLEIEESRRAAIPQPMVAATQSKNHLFTRIKHMMTMKTRSLNTGQKMATTLAFILAFATVAWVRPSVPDQLGLSKHESPAYGSAKPFNLEYYIQEEQAPDAPPPPSAGYLASAETGPMSNPITLHLDDGTELEFEGLSEKDREKIRKAMEEVRLALQQIPEEVLEEMNTEEFRKEMKEAREEIRQAMKELNAVEWDSLMQEVGKAVNEGMQKFHEAMQVFDEGMQELGPALQEMFRELEEGMQQLQEELKEKED